MKMPMSSHCELKRIEKRTPIRAVIIVSLLGWLRTRMTGSGMSIPRHPNATLLMIRMEFYARVLYRLGQK